MSYMSKEERIREAATNQINAEAVAHGLSKEDERVRLEEKYGQVWDTRELQEDFKVEGFAAPCAVVVRKEDGAKGLVSFQHDPRFYFSFMTDKEMAEAKK